MGQINRKFSEKQFLLFVVNYIAGFGFIATAISLFRLGPFSWLIFLLVSLVSLIVTLSFARLSSIDSQNYGGPYLWAKKAVDKEKIAGRMFSFFTGWNNFIIGPLSAATAPLFILNSFSGIDGIRGNLVNTWILIAIGFSFYVLLAFISTKGTSLNKKLIALFASVKWIVILSALIVAIYVIARDGNGYSQNNNLESGFFGRREISFAQIATVFITFFYSYAGVEDISVMTPDVKTNNFRKILIVSFIAVFLFYFIGIIILNGLQNIAQRGGEANSIGNVADIFKKAAGLGTLIFYGVGALFNNVSTRLSTIIANSRKILPLAYDNYFPSFFYKQNKKGEFQNAIWFTFGTTLIAMTLLVFIPLVASNFDFDNATEYAASVGSAATLLQYIFVFFIIFKFIYKKEPLYQKKWVKTTEELLFCLGTIVIVLMLLVYLFPVIDGFSKWETKHTLTIVLYGVLSLIGLVLFLLQEYKHKNKQNANKQTTQTTV